MKIRLDQNLSYRVARGVVAALPNRDGYEVTYVGDVHPPGTSDPDWLREFAAEGGTAIVSGDYEILQHFPDLVAYTETGMISFFPPRAWEKLGRFGKIAFLIRWWPEILEKIKISQRGDRWRLPLNWSPSHTDMQLLQDPRIKGSTVVEPEQTAKVIKLKTDKGK